MISSTGDTTASKRSPFSSPSKQSNALLPRLPLSYSAFHLQISGSYHPPQRKSRIEADHPGLRILRRVSTEIWKCECLESLLQRFRLSEPCCCQSILLLTCAYSLLMRFDVKIIDGSILCVHGGLSPEVRTIDQIRVIARAQEIPHEGAFCGSSSRPFIHSFSDKLYSARRFDVVGSRRCGHLVSKSTRSRLAIRKSRNERSTSLPYPASAPLTTRHGSSTTSTISR